jgi:hypothetical protein
MRTLNSTQKSTEKNRNICCSSVSNSTNEMIKDTYVLVRLNVKIQHQMKKTNYKDIGSYAK